MIKFDPNTRGIELVKGDYGELHLTDLQVFVEEDNVWRSFIPSTGDVLRIIVNDGIKDQYPTPQFSVDANEENVFIFTTELVADVPCKAYNYDLKLILADGKVHTIDSLKPFVLRGTVA